MKNRAIQNLRYSPGISRDQWSGFGGSGSGSGISSESGSGSRVLMTKNWRKKQLKKICHLMIKNCNLHLYLGFVKVHPSYRRSLHTTKREHPAFQNMKFSTFLRSWIRIQSRSGYRSGSTTFLETIVCGLKYLMVLNPTPDLLFPDRVFFNSVEQKMHSA